SRGPLEQGLRCELVLHLELDDDLVARAREAEARPDDELHSAGDLAIEGGEDVVLLPAGGIDVADRTDPAEELERRLKSPRQAIVDAGGVVELERPPLLTHRRQLEGRVQVDREAPQVAGDERPEFQLEIRLRVVRHLGLEVPSEVEREAALVPQRPSRAEARARV